MRKVLDDLGATSAKLRAGHTTGAYSFAPERYRAVSYRTRDGGSFSIALLARTDTVTPDGNLRIDIITVPAGEDQVPVFSGRKLLQVTATDLYTVFAEIPPARSSSPLTVVASNSETTGISAQPEGGGTVTWP